MFNHPSNVVSLSLLNGSGYYHAEIETIKILMHENDDQKQASKMVGNVLKINQISSSSVIVSPLVNNGLTYLHVFDYCVPPGNLAQKISVLSELSIGGQLVQWPASTTSKIQVIWDLFRKEGFIGHIWSLK